MPKHFQLGMPRKSAQLARKFVTSHSKKMDPEQEVREFQREYLDFLDDEVSQQPAGAGADFKTQRVLCRRTRDCTMTRFER